MDWIDEVVDKWSRTLRMKSIKSVLRIYIIMAIIIVAVVYGLTVILCVGWSYIAKGVMLLVVNLIMHYSIVVYSLLAIIFITQHFYKEKVENPIEILKEEAACIARGDLSISCLYESGDEFGEVCEAFELMRLQMVKNHENMWSQMEGQRQINAAFAHDIRTPLTVTLGYTEMLNNFYPKGKISEEKLLETLKQIQTQLIRMQEFIDTMKELNHIEAVQVRHKRGRLDELTAHINENINGLAYTQKMQNIELEIICKLTNDTQEGYYDEDIILEVVNNLLTNAVSFAKSRIMVRIEAEEQLLLIYVQDDGNGFAEHEIYRAADPYYSSRTNKENHYGLGLTISRILCEKHGGKLILKNSVINHNNSRQQKHEEKAEVKAYGAIVCASFHI